MPTLETNYGGLGDCSKNGWFGRMELAEFVRWVPVLPTQPMAFEKRWPSQGLALFLCRVRF
jgi:hypothetical protein